MAQKNIPAKVRKEKIKKTAKLPMLSRIYLSLAVVFFAATVFVSYNYRHVLYFGYFHKPLGYASAQANTYKPANLPKFDVSTLVSSNRLSVGDILTIKITARADRDISATPKVWIAAPNKKQVFKSPEDGLVQFKAGQSKSFEYSYKVPANLAKGTYSVSCIINSENEFTDYYVNTKFAKIQIQ